MSRLLSYFIKKGVPSQYVLCRTTKESTYKYITLSLEDCGGGGQHILKYFEYINTYVTLREITYGLNCHKM